MITFTLTLNVPELPENDIWFANANAWYNYFRSVSAEASVDATTVQLYSPVAYNDALEGSAFYIDDTLYNVPTTEQFNSLKAQLAALDSSYKQLRTELRDAGYIDKAQ